MPLTNRILPAAPFATLDDYLAAGGGRALEAARRVEPEALIGEIEASGLRGRGGAGFPTATKWRTVAANASPELPTTVVVNAAEGEPGTYKDRTILRLDPYAVLEGALVALYAVGAGDVVVALKAREPVERERVERAIDEMAKADLLDGVTVSVVTGPHEYLFGEETALLEVVDGRPPLPRIAPPYRRGVVEVVEHDDDVASGSGQSAHVEMAGPDDGDPGAAGARRQRRDPRQRGPHRRRRRRVVPRAGHRGVPGHGRVHGHRRRGAARRRRDPARHERARRDRPRRPGVPTPSTP